MGHQNPYGNAPRIGNSAPGEPTPTPSASDSVDDAYGGAPSILGDRQLDRGELQVDRPGGGQVVPEVYGGAPAFLPHPDTASPKGSGDGTGGGATSGTTVP